MRMCNLRIFRTYFSDRTIGAFLAHRFLYQIGDYWFYFGGITAEEMEPDEYVKKFSVEKIAGIVFRVFEEWRASGFFTDEYRYCFTFLYFHGRNNFPIQYPAQLPI